MPVLTEFVEGEETDPTYDPEEEEEEVPEGKGKGKAKVKEEKGVESLRWTKMFGGNRCGGCRGSTEDCEVSIATIERWEKEAAQGKEFNRAPALTGCRECKRKKMTCTLPRMVELRKAAEAVRLEEKKSVEGSDSKRKREEDAEDAPPWKRLRMRKVTEGYAGPEVLEWLVPLLAKFGRQLEQSARHQKQSVDVLERIAEAVGNATYAPESEEESEGGGSVVTEGELMALWEESKDERKRRTRRSMSWKTEEETEDEAEDDREDDGEDDGEDGEEAMEV